jgi:hypothetical protein
MDRATTAVLQRLRRGPASTVELQAHIHATHVAKQVYDLRSRGYVITMARLASSGVALYTLLSEPDVLVGAGLATARGLTGALVPVPGTVPAPSRAPGSDENPSPRAPIFGDPALLREMRPKGRR